MLMPDELMFLSVCSLQIRTTIRRCLVSWTTASWLPMPLACSSGEYACVSAHMAPFACAFDQVLMFFCFCFCSGIFGERLPLRYYLSFGMLTSGLFTCLFGLGFYWKIHSLAYYAFIQVLTQRHVNTTHTLDNSSISEWVRSPLTVLGRWIAENFEYEFLQIHLLKAPVQVIFRCSENDQSIQRQ